MSAQLSAESTAAAQAEVGGCGHQRRSQLYTHTHSLILSYSTLHCATCSTPSCWHAHNPCMQLNNPKNVHLHCPSLPPPPRCPCLPQLSSGGVGVFQAEAEHPADARYSALYNAVGGCHAAPQQGLAAPLMGHAAPQTGHDAPKMSHAAPRVQGHLGLGLAVGDRV